MIARSEDEQEKPGLAGLSLFLVRAYTEGENGERIRHATVEGVEEKSGHHASATCAIRFENTPAELIGNRGEGFRYMLKLMNGARVGVGFECLSLCESATRKAKEYALERRSMGKVIAHHELIASYLEDMELRTRGIRALAVEAAWEEERSRGLRMDARDPALSEEERSKLTRLAKRHSWRARLLTPLLKYQAAEDAILLSRMCVQIHGGVGYTREYGAEKLVRDALGMPIYEGTSQIQSLMVMKDQLQWVMGDPQRFVRKRLANRWTQVQGRFPNPPVCSIGKSRSSGYPVIADALCAPKAGRYSSDPVDLNPVSGLGPEEGLCICIVAFGAPDADFGVDRNCPDFPGSGTRPSGPGGVV